MRALLFYYGLVASLLDLSGSVQEGDDLGAGADGVGGERRGARAGGHALFDRPVDGGRVVGVSAHVGEDGLCRGGGADHAIEERHALGARAALVRGERGLARAGRDAVLDGPQDGVIVIVARGHVGERVHRGLDGGAAGGAIQEGDDLSARAGGVRGERRGGGALGHALFDRPVDGGRVVGRSQARRQRSARSS